MPVMIIPVKTYALDTEYQVKGAYLYNFMRFINWKNEDNYPSLNFCILGNSPFAGELKVLQKKQIRQHSLNIHYINDSNLLKTCHVVFISRSESPKINSILKHVANMEILTVSDINNFSKKGGIIELFVKNNKIRFRINLTQARSCGLYISSKLLEIADKVY